MKAVCLFIFLLILNLKAYSQKECIKNRQSVFFGERIDMDAERAQYTIRVFLDKEGTLYPDVPIDDTELQHNCSSLKELYRNKPALLSKIARQYKCDNEGPVEEKIACVNTAIAKAVAERINKAGRGADRIDILIHGFRKKMYGGIYSGASVDDNAFLASQLSKQTKEKIVFVEVYWDGKYRDVSIKSSFKEGGVKQALLLFQHCAVPNAINAGIGLRAIVSNIHKDHINVITHSLGALVGCELLFNAEGNDAEKTMPAPGQKDLRLCMIAPAIGAERFDGYYKRGPLKLKDAEDNYRVFVAYNKTDIVLNKNFKKMGLGMHPLPTAYGNTSLGIDYKGEIGKLKERIKGDRVVCVDYTAGNGFSHYLKTYVMNTEFKKMAAFLE